MKNVRTVFVGRRTMLRLACAATAAIPLLGLKGRTQAIASGVSDPDRGEDGRHVCTTADCAPYVYDPVVGNPAQGVAPGTPFAALPEGWRCPSCGSGVDAFVPVA